MACDVAAPLDNEATIPCGKCLTTALADHGDLQ